MLAVFIIAYNKRNQQSIIFANQAATLDLDLGNPLSKATPINIPLSDLSQPKINQLVIELPNNKNQQFKTLENISINPLNLSVQDHTLYCITYEETKQMFQGQYIKDITHNMNNKLTGISHGIDLLTLQNTSVDSDLIDEIKKSLKILQNLTKQLREHYETS